MDAIDLPQGTLDLLILRLLATGEMHAWGVARRLSLISGNALKLHEGTFYPALYRMEAKDWIVSEWKVSEHNRRAKFYRLTKVGLNRLKHEEELWDRTTSFVAAVLKETRS